MIVSRTVRSVSKVYVVVLAPGLGVVTNVSTVSPKAKSTIARISS
jgi:hypothetical protein